MENCVGSYLQIWFFSLKLFKKPLYLLQSYNNNLQFSISKKDFISCKNEKNIILSILCFSTHTHSISVTYM